MTSERTMNPGTSSAGAKPRKPRFFVTVKRVQRLTPHMVRITFTSPQLATFEWSGPAAHIKLLLPTLDGDADNPKTRTYTPRRFDSTYCELDVDFVLHGTGPAAAWAAQAAEGQTLTVAGPGRGYAVYADADWFLLVGDDTAIPALATILEALPASAPVMSLIEIVDAGEEHQICHGRDGNVTWLHRGPDATHAGEKLEAAVRAIDLPEGMGRVYVACEAGAMRRIRRHLLTERAIDRDRIVTRGYWRLGKADHPDQDFGE